MAKNAPVPANQAGGNDSMSSEEASAAIQRATQQTPQLMILREKLIAAIEKQDGGMESLLRAIRSKLHEV